MPAQNGSSSASTEIGKDDSRDISSGPNIMPSAAPRVPLPVVRRNSRLFMLLSLFGKRARVHILHELDESIEVDRAIIVHRHVPRVRTEQITPLGQLLRHPL